MKIFRLALTLAAMTASLQAQGMSTLEMRVEAARSAFAATPRHSRKSAGGASFWTPFTLALVGLDGAAKAADSFATRKNMDGGGAEYDALARPFVHTTGVQVTAMAALYGAEITMAYVLHRRHHNNLSRVVLAAGAAMNALGAAESFKRRVANW